MSQITNALNEELDWLDSHIAKMRELVKELEPVLSNDGWCPFATKRPLTEHNYWDGRSNQPIKAVCIHIAAGSMSAIYPTFNTPNGSSSHFAVSRSGLIEQYVSINDTAWCNGLAWKNGAWYNPRGIKVSPTWKGIVAGINPNLVTVSIEHEGQSGDKWTPAMFQADVMILKWIAAQTGLKWEVGTTLIGHYMIDPVDRPNDPGSGISLQTLVDAV